MGAIPEGLRARLGSIIGGPRTRLISRWGLLVPKIAEMEPELMKLDDYQLRKRGLALRYRARSGEPLDRLLPEAYASVREAARRKLNMRHFDVQILGGIAMFNRSVVEMQTGEGKTLCATLPMYLRALAGKGAHLATVNDYLAQRDADWMRPIYEALGLTVGVVVTEMDRAVRGKEYASDVTYGTSKEFGFDFLRDRLLLRRIREGQTDLLGSMLGGSTESDEKPVQRDPYFALVDEADCILIDEARTPMIIAALATEEASRMVACYQWSAQVAKEFEDEIDYEYDHDKRKVELTREGRQKCRILSKPDAMAKVGMITIYKYIERAILCDKEYHLDRQYVVKDGDIVIVDEFTGRLSEGRKWRDGIHQACEAKEKVKVTVESGQAARITVQDFFLRYENLAGMTGTCMTSKGELRRIYKVRVLPMPTNRPSVRIRLPDRVFPNALEKWLAVVDEVAGLHRQGRPVLIGTRSIDKSELLAKLLTERGVDIQVLNANHIEEEADIIANAGQEGKVTVSTNMAGRGTDIKLGDGVATRGGLHVICTEMHDSARVDRQLMGRCGRQGDPGTCRQYLALDDDLLNAGYGPDKAKRYREMGEDMQGELAGYHRLFHRAQHKIERRHFRDRRTLMYFEKERKKMHRQMGQDPYLDMPG